MSTILCSPRVYQYKGWVFEDHAYCGPWPLKKNGDPRKRAGRVFYRMYAEFSKLSEKQRESCRVGGGCVFIKGGNHG